MRDYGTGPNHRRYYVSCLQCDQRVYANRKKDLDNALAELDSTASDRRVQDD